MSRLPFTKMVGTGNDFVVVDATRRPVKAASEWRRMSRALCDRHQGIGADGVLVLERTPRADVRMRVFNPDGSEAEGCGNGARCVALYAYAARAGKTPGLRNNRARVHPGLRATRARVNPGLRRDAARVNPGRGNSAARVNGGGRVTIDTIGGVLSATIRGNRVALTMPTPSGVAPSLTLPVGGRRYRVGVVNTGVPHAVVPVASVDRVDVEALGQRIRRHRHFAPRGTNVNFTQWDSRRRVLRVRTYERGVEAETLACGTGIVASAILHAVTRHRTSRAASVRVPIEARSGDRLSVSMRLVPQGRRVQVRNVVLEGAAERVFDGQVEWPVRAR